MKLMSLQDVEKNRVLVNPLQITKVHSSGDAESTIFLTDGNNVRVKLALSSIVAIFEECTDGDMSKLCKGGK